LTLTSVNSLLGYFTMSLTSTLTFHIDSAVYFCAAVITFRYQTYKTHKFS